MSKNQFESMGLMQVQVSTLLKLMDAKSKAIDKEEARTHDENIRRLMVGQTKFSWWHGQKKAPDISYEEAAKLYDQREVVPTATLGGFTLPSRKGIEKRRFTRQRQKLLMLSRALFLMPPTNVLFMSIETMAWLKTIGLEEDQPDESWQD